MSEAEERALSQALHTLVPDPVVPTGLADLARRRYSRRRALTIGGTTAAVLVAGAGATAAAGGLRSAVRKSATPGATPSRQRLRDAIRGGRIVTTIAFDHGALTIAPPPAGNPLIDRDQAIKLFRSTSIPAQLVTDVLVAYATVTVRANLRPDGGMRLDGVPAWVVVYGNGPHGCPAMPAPPAGEPEGRQVFLLDAGSAIEATVYHEAGSVCGQPPTGPTVAVAQQYSSVPWVPTHRTPYELTVRYQPDGGCAPADVTVQTDSTPQGLAVTVLAARSMWKVPCPGRPSGTTTVPLPAPDTILSHAPVGPVTAFYTRLSPAAFDFYDGTR